MHFLCVKQTNFGGGVSDATLLGVIESRTCGGGRLARLEIKNCTRPHEAHFEVKSLKFKVHHRFRNTFGG